jgi:hypothetical protein
MSDPMARRSTTGLEVCLLCEQDFVSVVRCTNAGSDSWWLLLRCGACGTWHETFAQGDALRALRQATARSLETVAERWKRLDLDRMSWQIEAFSQALERDLIAPDDF